MSELKTITTDTSTYWIPIKNEASTILYDAIQDTYVNNNDTCISTNIHISKDKAVIRTVYKSKRYDGDPLAFGCWIPTIKKVEILNPKKVIRFTFDNIDQTTVKTICSEEDNFDFKFAFYLAYAKYLYKNTLTPKGIERKAKEFEDFKIFNYLVNNGIKTYYKDKKAEEKAKAEEAERKEIKKRQAAKKAKKRAEKKAKNAND